MNFVFFAGNGALTLFAYPLIFAFEKIFSLVSDVSLLELSDTNSPLLRELAQKAPGTFQHSIQVANIAEEGILEIKGNALYCYITVNNGVIADGDLERELKNHIAKTLGPFYRPELIQFSPGLPKTRSGKIMRRILRKIAANDYENLGDTSTLADPSIVDSLIQNRKNKT